MKRRVFTKRQDFFSTGHGLSTQNPVVEMLTIFFRPVAISGANTSVFIHFIIFTPRSSGWFDKLFLKQLSEAFIPPDFLGHWMLGFSQHLQIQFPGPCGHRGASGARSSKWPGSGNWLWVSWKICSGSKLRRMSRPTTPPSVPMDQMAALFVLGILDTWWFNRCFFWKVHDIPSGKLT